MTKLNVNIGQSVNDKTGDTLRSAFDKINQNFTELYTLTGAAQVQSDWAQTTNTALDFIKNKPTLFSGSYTDLTNKPTISAGIGDFTFTNSSATVPVNTTLTLTAFDNTTKESKLTLSPTTKSSLYAANNLELGIGYGTGFEKYWLFGSDGSIRFPDTTVQTTAFTGSTTVSSLVNGAKTVSLDLNGLTTFPTFQTGTESLYLQGTEFGSVNSGVAIAAKNQIILAANVLGNQKNWNFGTEGKLTLPAGTTYEYVNAPLIGHGDGLARLDFTLVTDGVDTQWAAASASPAGSGYSPGDTFTFDAEFLGIPGASVTIEVLTVGAGGSVENLGFSQPPLYPADIYRDSPINLQVGPESNRWTFGASGDLTVPGGIKFPDALSIKNSVIGKASTATITEGEASQTTAIESQIEITTTGVVIAKRTSVTVNDGVTTTVNDNGSTLELDNTHASITYYIEPDGPDNNSLIQFTTDSSAGGGATIETVTEDVGGTAHGRVRAAGNSVQVSAKTFLGTNKTWSFTGAGDLQLPESGNILSNGANYIDLANFETSYNDAEGAYQDALTAWMTLETFRPVWFALPGRLAYDEMTAWTPTTGQPALPLNLPPVAKNAQDSYAAWQETIALSKLTVASDIAEFDFNSTGKLRLPQGGTVGGGDQADIDAAYDDWQADEAAWQYLITTGGADLNVRPWNFAGPSRAEKQAIVLSMWQAQQSGDTLDWIPISSAFYSEARAWLAFTANQDGYENWKKLTTSVNITSDDKTWTFTNDGTTQFPDDTINAGTNEIYIQSSNTVALSYTALDGNWESQPNQNQIAGLAASSYGVNITLGRTNDGVEGPTWSHEWLFDKDGVFTLPEGGTISEGGGLTGAIKLKPAGGANDYQALLIYPTAGGDGDHIHLTAGGGTTELYLGSDNHYVKLASGGVVRIQADNGVNSSAAWTFGTDGAITTTDPLTLNVPGVPNGVANWNGQGGWDSPPYTNKATTGGTGTGLTVNVSTATGGYIDINAITINTAGTGYTNGDIITITNENNLPGTFTITVPSNNWTFGANGNTTFPTGLTLGAPRGSGTVNFTSAIDKEFQIETGTASYSKLWRFETNGNTTLPTGLTFRKNGTPYSTITADLDKVLQIETQTSGGVKQWSFGTDGKLTLPDAGIVKVGVDTAQVGSSLVIETGGAYGDTAVSIASNPTLATTYPAGSTVTFQDGDVRTITAYDNYPGGTDIFWNTPKTGTLFPITLKTANYVAATTSAEWEFGTTGRTIFPNGTVPEHSYGAAGDKEGMVVFSDPYIYYCKQDYVNNTTDIWVRVAWTGTNW